jgi:hypothetical protein
MVPPEDGTFRVRHKAFAGNIASHLPRQSKSRASATPRRLRAPGWGSTFWSKRDFVNLPASLRIQYASQVAGLAAVLVAAAAFIGWWALLASWAGPSSSTPTDWPRYS